MISFVIKQQLHLSLTLPKISYSQSSVSSKFTDYLLFTVISQQQIYRIFAIGRHLSPAILPNICYRQISVSSHSVLVYIINPRSAITLHLNSLVFLIFGIKYHFMAVQEQPGGGFPALNVMKIREGRQATGYTEADVDVAPP